MKDGKKIIVTNPYLMRLRNNLRKLISIAFNEEQKKLMNKITQIEDIRRNLKDDQIKAQMGAEIKNLRKEKNHLRDVYNKSILRCGICKTLEDDRIYYKRFDTWYCPKCFEENYKHWAPLEWEPRYPLSKEQVLEFLNKLDKVVGQCKTNLNLSRNILNDMGIKKSDQKIFLDTLYHYGGHCDCEIMLNAAPNVLADFGIEEKN